MHDSTRLDDLISRWHEGFARGEDTPASALCRDCPELAPELERWIDAQRKMKAVFGGVAATTPAQGRSDPTTLDHAAGSPFNRINDLCREFAGEWERGRPELASYLDRVAPDLRPPLFRNLLEHEVRTRRRAGEMPCTEDYVHRLPAHYSGLIRQVFLDTSSVSVAASFDPLPAPTPGVSRLGDYRLVRELGRGGMGAVFEAVHLGRGHRVALKVLPAVSGDLLHRFKREFRALADVTHPNLVGLRTLESDGAQWFITLDLLEGVDFLRYVRPGDGTDEARLRAALAQLAAGVMALHARGVLHRDLKPGNVMVTGGGRVVILDFGLVAELRGDAQSSAGVAGTPAYMAPEQAAGQSVGPPADWYAVGVMLYEALAGVRPFVGDTWKVLSDKQAGEAPPLPRGPGAPADLIDLAMRLLARAPAARPDPLAIAGVVAASAVPSSGPPGPADQLIGREPQLAALADAMAAVRRTREPVMAFVRGRSGEGKTSLAEAFLSPLRRDPAVVVLAGRCYDRESVPFKALDTLIDALTAHLRALEPVQAAQLLPDDIGLLAHLFPVLNRCEVVASAPRGRMDALDQQQVRQRAFASLRLLLERVGGRTPVVCFVDDLQWGDADSAAALFEVLRPPTAPTVLFLGSYRSDEADDSPFLAEWAGRQKQNGVSFEDWAVSVGPLSLDEAARLVANVVGRDDEVVRRRVVQFHAQTGGNPFLLTELAGCFDPDADAFHATDIHGVLARKLGELPAEAGPLLAAVSVSGQAVELAEAAEAAGLADSPEIALTRMRNARLLRVVGAKVDTYHDRIRYAVLDQMPDGPKRELHRRLAEVIERSAGGLTDEQIAAVADRADTAGVRALERVYDLSYHFDAVADRRRALAYALAGATQARSQSALDVAAQQYTIAERNATDAPAAVRFRIARGLGEIQTQLGRYPQAKQELDAALGLADRPYDLADVRGLQGVLAFKLGLIRESTGHLEEALRLLGVKIPRTRLGLWWGLVAESVVQVAHNFFPWRLKRHAHDPGVDLANQLLGWLEYDYYFSNVVYLVWASLLGLNRAERLPASPALAFNFVVHANDMAVVGWHGRAVRYYRAASELSERLNDRWGVAHALNHHSLGCLGAARYEEVIEKATQGTIAFGQLGDMLELHHAHFNISQAEHGLGRLDRAVAKAWWVFDSSVRIGDNIFGPLAFCLWARASLGRVPFDELAHCVQALPGNHNAAIAMLMAEGYWRQHRGETGDAVRVFERAWEIARANRYIVAFNTWVLTELVSALRRHAEAIAPRDPGAADIARRRWARLARWANRLSWFLPPERPRALRELALVYEHHARLRKAWKLAAKSCRIAETQGAKYEHAQSLLVRGRLAKLLGRPEADDQVREASAELDRIEASIDVR